MRVAPQMAAHVATGGSLILSGILERQREAVLAAYVGQRFRHVRTLRREGWVTLHLKRVTALRSGRRPLGQRFRPCTLACLSDFRGI